MNNSLTHTKWECKYHIVFIPKYRKQTLMGEVKVQMRRIIKELCQYQGVKILEGAICKDHVHLYLSIPPKYSISKFMGYLKGKSALRIYQECEEVRKYSKSKIFWARGYYVTTVGADEETIKKYIRDQRAEEMTE